MAFILTLQGWFYLVTGLWPVLHIKSFEKVTGPKTDKWLVKTVGLMITCSGIIFLKFTDDRSALWLAVMNAVTLAGVDIYYSLKGIIRKIYLLDAVVELGFVVAYIFV